MRRGEASKPEERRHNQVTDPNTPQSATSGAPEPEGPIGQLLAQLRAALAIPKADRSPDWEEATAKLVALTAVDYLKQPDDSIALQELALVHLAGTRGCKSARKRELSPLRWRERPPPRLSETFADADEAKAAVVGVSALRADWVVRFVLEELRSPSLEAARAELIAWAAANSSNLASLLNTLAAAFPLSSSDSRTVLFEATALLLRPEILSTHAIGDDFLISLVDLIGQAAAPKAPHEDSVRAESSQVESLAVQVVVALDALTSVRPALLVRPASSALLREAGRRVPHWPTSVKQAVTRVLQRVVSLLECLQSVDSSATASLIAEVSKGYAAALPAAAKAVPERDTLMRLGTLATGSEKQGASAHGAEEMEQSLATLLAEWDAFAMAAGASAEVTQIGKQIEAVARLAHVERFGALGDVVAYEPLQHHLTGDADVPPLRVLICRSGVRKQRPDGSFRVILKALAEPRDGVLEG